jgi:hypothetical protein
VFYTQDAVETVFQETNTHHSDTYRSHNISTADAPGVVELQVGRECSFQLLQFTKGSLVPSVGGPAVTASSGLRSVLPECAAANARYSRISYLTVGMMRKLFEHDQQTLLQYRQQCLPSDHHSVSASASTTVNAPAIKTQPSAWGAKPNSVAATTSINTVPAAAAPATAAPAWGTTRLQDLLRQTSDSSHSAPDSPHAPSTSAVQSSAKAALLEGGDVEALPFIALALERQQVLESEFEAKLALQPLPVQPQREAGEGLVRRTSSSGSVGGGAGGSAGGDAGGGVGSPTVDQSSAAYHTHQHISGSLVFLHPICTKCLLDASHTTPSDVPTSTLVGPQVRGKVLEIEHLRVSADSRQRYTVLRHLPLHSEVTFIEIDVAPLVPAQVLSKYSEELHKRANKRRERVKQERREKRLEQDQL